MSIGRPLAPSTNGGSAISRRPSDGPCGGVGEDGSPNTKVTRSPPLAESIRTSVIRSDGSRPVWVSTGQASAVVGTGDGPAETGADAVAEGEGATVAVGPGLALGSALGPPDGTGVSAEHAATRATAPMSTVRRRVGGAALNCGHLDLRWDRTVRS